jgi:hypothetical protein
LLQRNATTLADCRSFERTFLKFICREIFKTSSQFHHGISKS